MIHNWDKFIKSKDVSEEENEDHEHESTYQARLLQKMTTQLDAKTKNNAALGTVSSS